MQRAERLAETLQVTKSNRPVLGSTGGYFFMVLNISRTINAKITISIKSPIRATPFTGLRRRSSLLFAL